MKKASNAHILEGFSLPEIIISLFLSGVILLFSLRYYVLIKQQFIHVQTTIEDQMDLTWIVDILREKVSQAGSTPCGNIKQLHTKQLVDVKIQNNSLELFHMSNPVKITSQLDSTHLILNQDVDLNQKLILIADCHFAELKIVKQQVNRIIILSQALEYNYSDPIYVGIWTHDAFFMKNHTALMYKSQHTEELSTFITDLSAKIVTPYILVQLTDKNKKIWQVITAVRSK